MEARRTDQGHRTLKASDIEQMRAERAQIEAEIRNYPAPIPGCDAQFNHLLERRAELNRRLAELRP